LRTHLRFIPVLFLAVFYSSTNVNATTLPDDSLITNQVNAKKVPDDSIITAQPVKAQPVPARTVIATPVELKKSAPQTTGGIAGVSGTKATNYKRWTGLKYSGYIRSYTQYRNMPVRYGDGSTGPQKLLTQNGLDLYAGSASGYNEPLFLLRIEGAPTAKTSFKLEYFFDNQMAGRIIENAAQQGNGGGATGTKRASAYRILQFEAKTTTKLGDFKILAGGGVLWYRMSPFILWQYQYRDDMFERYPWEPEGGAWGNRYSRYYGDGVIPRDARWGNSGNQGFVLEATNLPFGFEFRSLYGKTDNSGGFQTYLSKNPRNAIAEKLTRSFGAHKFSLGYFSQFGFLEAQAKYKVKQQIVTLEGKMNYDAMKIYFEVGAGRFMDSIRVSMKDANGKVKPEKIAGLNYNWSNGLMTHRDSINGTKHSLWRSRCINLTVDFQGKLTGLQAQVYSISKTVVNVNGNMINSANAHALANAKNIANGAGLGTNDITMFPGLVTEIDQMTNNRQALNLKYENGQRKFKYVVQTGMGQEIENLGAKDKSGKMDPRFNAISFFHRANAFTRSRFYYYNANMGPYGRLTNIFRRAIETIAITDDSVDYKKSFNTIDISLKYKISLFQRDMVFINYLNANTVTDKFSPIPLFNNKAFLQTYYNEFSTFYALHPKLTIMSFFSIERNIGNNRTSVADENGNLLVEANGRAMSNKKADALGLKKSGNIDQIDRGFGLGFDYDINGRTGFYVRHRWFSHADKNFTRDRFKGQETSVEFKVFF
jgi:hypothetical protein